MNSTITSMKRAQAKPLPRLVGITGRAGSGKDTIASYLRQHHHYWVFRFADPLKQALRVMFDIAPELWDDRVAKEQPLDWLGVSPRRLAQTLGTEWGRDRVHPDLWVLLMKRRIASAGGVHVVVPDVRFNNEAQLIQSLGGVVLRVSRPDAAAVEQHSSEAGVSADLVDAWVFNDGTIEELQREALQLLEAFT